MARAKTISIMLSSTSAAGGRICRPPGAGGRSRRRRTPRCPRGRIRAPEGAVQKVEWKVLVTDGLAPEAVSIFKEDARFQVDVRDKTSPQELLELIPGYDAVIVRSATKITADAIAKGRNLKAVARAGVGVDNIDVEAATKAGVLVVNTPEGNTISACEQTFALLLASARHIARADKSVRKGEWKRKENVGTELRGKTLAIVGLGKIGREVARRARAF